MKSKVPYFLKEKSIKSTLNSTHRNTIIKRYCICMKAVKIYTTIQTFEKEKKSGACEKMMKMKKRRKRLRTRGKRSSEEEAIGTVDELF